MNEPASNACDISVVVTAHAEGRLAHRTLRSVQAAIKEAEKHGLRSEIIIVLDNPTRETLEYFERWRDHARVLEVSTRDLSANRNSGIAVANGKYVGVVDADDLFGVHWLWRAYQCAENSGLDECIVHAQYTVYFEDRHEITRHPSSNDESFCLTQTFSTNFWTSVLFGPRAMLLKRPFPPCAAKSGFGYEDWHCACSAISAGGAVLTPPETVKFTRYKKVGSLLKVYDSGRDLIRPLPLFDPRVFGPDRSPYAQALIDARTKEHQPAPVPATTWKERLGQMPARISRATERYPLLQKALGAVYRKVVGPGVPEFTVPPWLLEQWRRIAEIEHQLFPDSAELARTRVYIPMRRREPDAYKAICNVLRNYHRDIDGPQFTHVYLLPWLKRGGAELVATHYINLVAAQPSHRVLVIATEDSACIWRSRLADSVAYLDFWTPTRELPPRQREHLLAELLVQVQPQVIHLFYSLLGSEVFVTYGHALSGISRLFASIYSYELLPEGKIVGLADEYAPRYCEHLSAIVSDNEGILSYLEETYALDPKKLVAHYQPTELREYTPRQAKSSQDTFNILWAGRLDRQKRPDLLLAIAKKCQGLNVKFHVYGSSMVPWDEATINFSTAPNLTYHGPFDGFHSLPTDQFDMFLNTSQWDGMPNILLEATSAGLPIVSSDVGGIGELVKDMESGLLVKKFDDVDEYVTAIKKLMADETLRTTFVENGRWLIQTRHCWEHFVADVNALEGYLLEPVSLPEKRAQYKEISVEKS